MVAGARLVLTMINFRFHLVSLIAVFLAMGLGILVGSTVVDQVIVDRLDREISSVSHESNQLKSENSALKDEVSKLNDFLRKSSAYAVQQRLTGVPVAIVAEKGIDAGAVNDVLASVRAAGADVPGVLWLDDKWRLDSPKDLPLAADRGARRRATSRRRASPRCARSRRGSRTRPRRDARAAATSIEPLRSAGFLDFTDGKTRRRSPRSPTRPARVLVLTGTDSRSRRRPTRWSTSCSRCVDGERADGARRGLRRQGRRSRRRPSAAPRSNPCAAIRRSRSW